MTINDHDHELNNCKESILTTMMNQLKFSLTHTNQLDSIDDDVVLVYGLRKKIDGKWRSKVMPQEIFEKIRRRDKKKKKLQQKENRMRTLAEEVRRLKEESIDMKDEMPEVVEDTKLVEYNDLTMALHSRNIEYRILEKKIISVVEEKKVIIEDYENKLIAMRESYLDVSETMQDLLMESLNLNKCVEIEGETKESTTNTTLTTSETQTTLVETDDKCIQTSISGLDEKEGEATPKFSGDKESAKWKEEVSKLGKKLLGFRTNIKAIFLKYGLIDAKTNKTIESSQKPKLLNAVIEVRELMNV